MKMKEPMPIRKQNRLPNYNYASNGAYFVTICTADRKNLFWEQNQPFVVGEDIILPPEEIRLSSYGKIVRQAILQIPTHYENFELLQYVIMPNHIHLILHIINGSGQMISAPTLSTIIGQMKRVVSKGIGQSVWQRSFHDHMIRDIYDYEEISKYVYENPSKWICDKLYIKE